MVIIMIMMIIIITIKKMMIMIMIMIMITTGATAWLEAKVTDNGAVEDNDDWKVPLMMIMTMIMNMVVVMMMTPMTMITGNRLMLILKPGLRLETRVRRFDLQVGNKVNVDGKHCQRHNGPMGWHHNWRHLFLNFFWGFFSEQISHPLCWEILLRWEKLFLLVGKLF